jgi:hypothetical protein
MLLQALLFLEGRFASIVERLPEPLLQSRFFAAGPLDARRQDDRKVLCEIGYIKKLLF